MKLAQPNERLEIDMLIHDCAEYSVALKKKVAVSQAWKSSLDPDAWEPTEDPKMQIIRLRQLKDLLMELNGLDPLKWAINRL